MGTVYYTENQLREFAEQAPDRLMAVARDPAMSLGARASAAEFLGDAGTPEADETLVELSEHESALVRDGVARGLEKRIGKFLGPGPLGLVHDRAKNTLNKMAARAQVHDERFLIVLLRDILGH